MTDEKLPEISDEDKDFLSYNPNTSDIIDWIHTYAREYSAALKAERDALLADAGRLDWMMLHISGRELRDMGVNTFDGCTRGVIDAAMGESALTGRGNA